MIDALPFGCSIYKVQFPHPIIYVFSLTGLVYFVWERDFDRKHGKYESNRRLVIAKYDSLIINQGQREPARHTVDQYVSINGTTVWQILSHHARTKPTVSFASGDTKLFFDNRCSTLNQVDQWIEIFGDTLDRDHPFKRRCQ